MRRAWKPFAVGWLGASLGCLGAFSAFVAPPCLAAESRFAAERGTRYAGGPLTDALLDLRRRGLKIVFSSNVVLPAMRVLAEPAATDLRQVLAELLAPHGLTARSGPRDTLVVLPPAAPVASGTATSAEAAAEEGLDPLAVFAEELVVSPSQVSLLRQEPAASHGLSREEILALPHLGDDFFRTLTLLPGLTANEFSARFHVRGGWRDETNIVLDGQELFDTFHLQDYDGSSSVVAPAILASAELATGGFSARFGDRMSGVLDLTTAAPLGRRRLRAGVGILGLHAGGGGELPSSRGHWLIELRRGNLDYLGRLFGNEDPLYWDVFAKGEAAVTGRHRLRGNLLRSDDALEFQEQIDGDRKLFSTAYDATHLWLTHEAIFGAGLLLETSAYEAKVERDRRGSELEEEAGFSIRDRRDLEVRGLRQDWSLQRSPRHSLSWGTEFRRFDVRYDYHAEREFDSELRRLRHDFGSDSTAFRGRFEERHDSLYVVDRRRWAAPLTVELGLRHDRYSQNRESLLSPRLSAALAIAERSVVRVAWGRYSQSQRPYELQVEDGETRLGRAERAEQRVVSFERRFAGRANLDLRIEAYRREIANPRIRYWNLFEPINTFPEAEHDRARIASERGVAEGVEVSLRGRVGERLGWWANATYATTEDRLGTAGSRWVPRPFDETLSVKWDLDYRLGQNWRLNLAWRFHTGWPTTTVSLEEGVDEDGEAVLIPVLGPLYGERLSDYHRLDLRASRGWRWRGAAGELFIDIQNLYNRRNLGGFDFTIDEERGRLVAGREEWQGFLPSAGISIEF
jgi:outer membrane receptor protein involved in Fe transport